MVSYPACFNCDAMVGWPGGRPRFMLSSTRAVQLTRPGFAADIARCRNAQRLGVHTGADAYASVNFIRFANHLIEHRRRIIRAAVAAQVTVAEVVGEDENNVRPFGNTSILRARSRGEAPLRRQRYSQNWRRFIVPFLRILR